MSVIEQDNQQTTNTGTAGRAFTPNGSDILRPFGNFVVAYVIDAGTNTLGPHSINAGTASALEVDFSSCWSGAAGTDQPFPRITGLIVDGAVTGNYGVMSYDPAGDCYLAVYAVTPGATFDINQTEVYLIGSSPSDPDINQSVIIGSFPNRFNLIGFNDELKFIRGDGAGSFINPLNLTVNNIRGICTNVGTDGWVEGPTANRIFATARLDAEIHAWTITNAATPAVSGLFVVSTGGDEARNITHSQSFDSIQVLAVVVIDGADNLVRLYDPDDGAFLGEYLNAQGGAITDILLADTCMYITTDAATNNLHSVDITDPTAPVFGTAETIPASDSGPLQVLNCTNGGIASFFGSMFAGGNVDPTGEANTTLLAIDGCAGGVTPPGASGKIACYAVGDFLYSVDDTPQLEVTDISDPSTPTSTGNLALASQPTAIWVNEHNAIVSFHDGFWIINIDDPAAPTLDETKTTGDNFDFVVAPGGMLYLSGEAAKLAVYDPSFTPPGSQDSYPIANGGISSIALEGSRVFFADIAPTGNSKLYSFATGGFTCSSVQAGLMSADEVKAEEFHGRHAKFKGAVVAESLLLTDELEATGIVLVDQTNGNRYRVQMIAGVLTETLL